MEVDDERANLFFTENSPPRNHAYFRFSIEDGLRDLGVSAAVFPDSVDEGTALAALEFVAVAGGTMGLVEIIDGTRADAVLRLREIAHD